MRRLGPTVLALGGSCWLVAAHAQDADAEAGPDLDFLEYLGAWAGDDEEWLAIEEFRKDSDAEDEKPPSGADTERDEDDEKSE
jgi:hypothetical protein